MSSAVPSPTAARRSTTGRHEAARGRTSHGRVTARAAALAVIVLMLLTLAVAPLRALIDQNNHLAQLEREADELTLRNAELESRIERFNDPSYLEQLARECLGMVQPGETAFVMVPARGAPPSPRC